jgi:pimeloyl-ACP methyl ester carboxylesterase
LEGGDGPPIVLLHGQGGFAAMWMPVIVGLVSAHHVVAPDLPGLGASEAPGGSPGAGMVLAWLGELIHQACASPPVLVGISLGGSIAARFAVDHSDRLAQLVLVDAGGLAGPVRPAPAVLLALVRHSLWPSKRTALRLLRHVTVDDERVRRQMGAGWEPFLEYMVDRSRTPSVQKANRRLLRELGFPRIPPEDLSRIRVPTTLVWGRHDRVMPLRTAEAASARYGWPLHVIEDAGHLVPAEQPEAVLRVLRAVLGKA